MSVFNPGEGYRLNTLSLKVDKATAALPATAAGSLFNVLGGTCAITQIIGEVTTVIQTQANDTKLTANPTTGTSVDICAALDISADEVGALYGITGLNSDAMIGINAGALPMQARSVAVNIGTIDLDCAATNTGSIKWSIFYYPLEDGASIEAV